MAMTVAPVPQTSWPPAPTMKALTTNVPTPYLTEILETSFGDAATMILSQKIVQMSLTTPFTLFIEMAGIAAKDSPEMLHLLKVL